MAPAAHPDFAKARLVCLGCGLRLRPSGVTSEQTCPSCGAGAFVTMLRSRRVRLWQPAACAPDAQEADAVVRRSHP